MIAHIGSLIVSLFSGCGWVVALVIYLMNKDKSKFASYHALQSLYFQGFIFLLAVVSGILMCVGIGFLLLPVVFIANIVLPIMVGIEANKGSLSEYPIVGAMAKQTIGI